LISLLALATTSTPSSLDALPSSRLDDSLRCHLGAYTLADGRALSINGDNGALRSLQYTIGSQEFGSLTQTQSGAFASDLVSIMFKPCAEGELTLTVANTLQKAFKVKLIERETSFVSEGIRLHGKLVTPAHRPTAAIAVWVEGSNNNPSTDDATWQYELARRGIGVFLYDKRGTGTSAGAPTSNFELRARDTAAAVREVRRLAPGIQRVGVIGASQGGWVTPLTSTMVRLDFIINAFSMAESPIEQDKAVVELQIRSAGFGDDVLSQARELTTITQRIVASNLVETPDLDAAFKDLEAFKARHVDAPWLSAIEPRSYTGLFLRFSTNDIKTNGPALAQGLVFDFQPRHLIEQAHVRQLWLLAGKDQQAPSAGTQRVLRDIQQHRRNISVAVFPDADHGLVEPLALSGRRAIGFSARQFDIAADWITYNRRPRSLSVETSSNTKP
jgi:uncharacterized protein